MKLSFLKEKGNKFAVLGLVGLLILIIMLPGESSEKKTEVLSTASETALEQRLEALLESMKGVGEAEVMLRVESTKGSVFGTAEEEGKVIGVVVVAEGAENAVVKQRISNAIEALFSIEPHKISIIKMRSQEDSR